MPRYPHSTQDAQDRAGEISSRFGNFECVRCAKKIVQALGPGMDADVIKLRCDDDSELIQMPGKALLVSRTGHHITGHHIGVRIGEWIFDNHHHAGARLPDWKANFSSATGAALIEYHMPIHEFFGRAFRVKEFMKFASNRRQISPT